MSDALITAIITGLITACGSIITTKIINDKTQAVMVYRIEELTKKVEKHNQVIERTAVLERDLKTAWRVIDEMKDDMKRAEEHDKKDWAT